MYPSTELVFSGPRTGSGGSSFQNEVYFIFVGVIVLQKNSKILSCIFLEKEPGPCPKAGRFFVLCLFLRCCFLTAPPLRLHSLPSLISNCLNLPFGAQRRSWRLNETYFLRTRNGGERLLYPGAPQNPAQCWFSHPVK